VVEEFLGETAAVVVSGAEKENGFHRYPKARMRDCRAGVYTYGHE
jgi:hypothetical protein